MKFSINFWIYSQQFDMKQLYPWQLESWQALRDLRGRLPHAVLLKGAQGIGKLDLALNFAQSLLCDAPTGQGMPCGSCDACRWFEQESHPDFRLVQPDALSASDETEEKSSSKKPSREIAVDSRSGGVVHGHQAGLSELRLADNQAIGGDVRQGQVESLRDAQPGAGDQPEERVVGQRAQRAPWSQARRGGEELLHLVVGEQVGQGAPAGVGEHMPWNPLVQGVLGAHVGGELTHEAETTLPLGRGWRLGRPLNCRLATHVRFRTLCCEPRKPVQQAAGDGQGEAARTAKGEIAVDREGQHDVPPLSGQGCAIARNRTTSTLA